MPTMTQFTRRSLFAVAALPVALSAAPAVAEDAHEKQLREDFAWLGKYAAENAALKASGKPVGVVFMGDSITEGWKGKHPDFFAAADRVCRGISGQPTPQMVLRLLADFFHLNPKPVPILSGTNHTSPKPGPRPPADRK